MYKSLMHIAFYTDNMDEMVNFYTNKLGGKIKAITKYGIYKDREDRPAMQKIAKVDPEKIFNIYVELAPLQFVEFFPATENQKDYIGWNEHKGYSHFALIVDDIYKAREELEARGVVFTTAISKGPSETYQMWSHDPDGNYFEIMQYTENSIQIKGTI